MRKSGIFIPVLILTLFSCSSGKKSSEIVEGRGITADSGMVVSAHPQSSRIGLSILRSGGNAIDAAVATQFALAVCFPEAGNIGGGGFMLLRTNDGKTDMIDFREKAPLKASRNMYLDEKGNVVEGLSTRTHLASGVPGSVDGMIRIHKKYGRLPFRDVIQPSIDLAGKGFPVTRQQAESFNESRQTFIEINAKPPVFVKDGLWKEGDTLRQEDLAETLKRIRDNGRDGFYSGKTAELIANEMKRGNGIISEEDLAQYTSTFRTPIAADYRGYRIISVPPPSSGGLVLFQILGMLGNYSLSDMGFHKAASIHLIAEAERRAYADRSEYLGDPDFVKIPTTLTDKNYLLKRMSDFNEAKASLSVEIKPGVPPGWESQQTTHFSVTDAMGNAVSVTTTLNGSFGNFITVEGAGFLLNNEMDDFSIKPGFPNMFGLIGGEANSIQPGKKMLSSMTPSIVEKNGKLFMIIGTPGGSTIPTSVLQVITNVIDYGMPIQEAVEAGRFHHQWLPDEISYEKGSIDSTVVSTLEKMGHKMVQHSSIGRISAILITDDGKIHGGADNRGDNTSCGY
jgi:gamma-glutamyltranspeptidase/glutathione hydrolase